MKYEEEAEVMLEAVRLVRAVRAGIQPCVKSLRSGDTTPCGMTGVTLHGVVSQEMRVGGDDGELRNPDFSSLLLYPLEK